MDIHTATHIEQHQYFDAITAFSLHMDIEHAFFCGAFNSLMNV